MHVFLFFNKAEFSRKSCGYSGAEGSVREAEGQSQAGSAVFPGFVSG